MYPYPICGAPSKITPTFYCAYERNCSLIEASQARFRRRTDFSGEVCKDVAVACLFNKH